MNNCSEFASRSQSWSQQTYVSLDLECVVWFRIRLHLKVALPRHIEESSSRREGRVSSRRQMVQEQGGCEIFVFIISRNYYFITNFLGENYANIEGWRGRNTMLLSLPSEASRQMSLCTYPVLIPGSRTLHTRYSLGRLCHKIFTLYFTKNSPETLRGL